MEARKNFKATPQAALHPYLQLQRLSALLKAAQPAAEHAAPHLIDHVERSAQTLWQQMKAAFAEGFEETLSKIHWPGKHLNLEDDLEQQWKGGVERLLDLQQPYVLQCFRVLFTYLCCKGSSK